MKIVAAILAALTLFMTAQEPVVEIGFPIAQNKLKEESCTTSQASCDKDVPVPKVPCNQDPCCDYTFCNPFGACCCYTQVEKTLLTVAYFSILQETLNPDDDDSLSSYIAEIWQPPETASDI